MRNSKILKCISYVLIPFLILIIVLPLLYEVAKNDIYENQNEEEIDYFQTDQFLSNYMYRLSNKARRLIFDNDNYKSMIDGEMRICYDESDKYEYEYYQIQDYYYLVIYKNLAITNVELTTSTNTIEGVKNFISSQDAKKSNLINGTIESDSDLIKAKAIQYFDNFIFNYYSIDKTKARIVSTPTVVINEEPIEIEEVEEYETPMADGEMYSASGSDLKNPSSDRTYYTTSVTDFQMFTSYKEEVYIRERDVFLEKLVTEISVYEEQLLDLLPIAAVLLVVIFIYLIISIGHTKGKEGIDLNDLDKIPIEIILTVAILGVVIIAIMASEGLYYTTEEYYVLARNLAFTGYFIAYILCAITGVTLVKRIKAKTLIKDSITGRVCKFCFKVTKKVISDVRNIFKKMTNSLNSTIKVAICIMAYIFWGFALIITLRNPFIAIIVMACTIYGHYKFIEKMNCYHKIEDHLKGMYEGDNSKKLISSDFTPEFQNVITYINDISCGFENAIEEGIKSERLKTELITNVSHDIKTPLTSIINYVDLIKKEELENEKIKEYVDILDSKSQRLKKLTEDLVEASKASSGNVKLNFEKINTVELIKQCVGEFEDKFSAKNLEVITSTSDDEIFINADSRYMYRVIENLFGNISKYALDGSRVYIDIGKVDSKVRITIKNISKERLNISADELMQRFVRGDKSRTTEGSGLGISISKSLTELQKGKFELQVDGDLFKVELEFEVI